MKGNSFWSRSYIGFILLFLYVPMLAVVVFSFNASKSVSSWGGFTFFWYVELVKDASLSKALATSLTIATATCVIAGVIGTLGAVYVQRMKKRYQTFVSALVYIPLVIPEIILAIGLMMSFAASPLRYGYLTLILGHSTFCVPYVYLMVGIRLGSIEPSLLEAARDLGASKAKAFFTITLPLVAPAILSGGLLAFAMSLDDVIISSFLSSPKTQTLPVLIFSMLRLGVTPKINALCSLILFVTFVAVFSVQFGAKIKQAKNEK